MSRPEHQIKDPQATNYVASYTLSKLHLSTQKVEPYAQIRGVMGPLGSGKSVGCCWEIMQQATRMPANAKGVRQSRWGVIRNTYRELEDTTIQTWGDWFPEENYGNFLRRGMTHQVRGTLDDGTKLELDVLFRALDRPQDVRKLLSLELTGAWVNESREVPRAVIDMLRKRVGRFPKYGSVEPYWHGVLLDTNPPEEDSYYYEWAESEEPLEGFEFFRQPSGRGPGAENLGNLPPGYYNTAGLRPDWIKVYIDGEYGYVQEGKPVYPEFYEQLHYVEELDPINAIITVGMDFGLTPAAAFIQQDPRGRYLCLDELVTENMGATQFAEELSRHIADHYPQYQFRFFGDPAGDERSQLDANQSVFDVLRANGINARPAPTQDWVRRRDAVANPLNTLIEGRPQLVIGGKCRYIRMGLAGKYNYKRVQIAGDERFHDKPDKNAYSHPVEALQYGMLGAGSDPIKARGRVAAVRRGPVRADTAFDIWNARSCLTFQQLAALLRTSGPTSQVPGYGYCTSS